MKPLSPDAQIIATFNAGNPNSRGMATRALQRLLNDATHTERAAIMGFVQGVRPALGFHMPHWAYQVVGELLKRYPADKFTDPKDRARHVLTTFRARLVAALRLRVKGAR